jgi:hypothetical protein
MFYQPKPCDKLRFGDVISGLLFSAPNLNEPHLSLLVSPHSVHLSIPVFSVLVTPCCSIEDKTISVTPLVAMPPEIFCTKAIEENPLIINSPMKQEDAIHPRQYENLAPERRTDALNYGFLNYFVYDESDFFDPYVLVTREGDKILTRKYAINFKDIYRVNCDKVQSAKQAPVELKRLELTPFTRRDLRYKVQNYYGRPTEEDKALLGE